MAKTNKRYLWFSLSPWAILGSLAVFAPLAFFLATSSINRDKENMTRLLVEKGAALIRSFEAGARTGMMGMGWGGAQVQRLLVETARQSDILYLSVTDKSGIAVAHSNSGSIGKTHKGAAALSSLGESEKVKWHKVQMDDGSFAFEVYKRFTPIAGMPRGLMRFRGRMLPRPRLPENGDTCPQGSNPTRQGDWCSPYSNSNAASGLIGPSHYIFVGLDMGALEAAAAEARRHALTMSAGVLLIGLAGMISLFLAHGYKLARRSLAKIRALSDQVVESLPVGLVASDESGRISSYNDTAQAILGIPRQEALGQEAAKVLPAELWGMRGRLHQQGALIEEDIECLTERARRFPLRLSAAVVRGEDRSFLGHVFIFRDLTEVRRLQREVERSRRLAALGNLAAGVAHEIRNPLSSIKGFATYFNERFRDHPNDQATAATMIQEVERLDRVIGQLLEFARPSSLKITSVAMAGLMQHTLRLIEGDARARGVEIKSGVPVAFPPVHMDEDRISQVLLNLYLNAIQAMDKGGVLEVRVSRDEERKQTVISVSDNGIGIDPEDKERIFDPYFTTKRDGTGLGLAIVHKIMEAHKGEVKVSSVPGRGTTVSLILPE